MRAVGLENPGSPAWIGGLLRSNLLRGGAEVGTFTRRGATIRLRHESRGSCICCGASRLTTFSALLAATTASRAFFVAQMLFSARLIFSRSAASEGEKGEDTGRWKKKSLQVGALAVGRLGDNAWDRSGIRQRKRNESAGAPTWRLDPDRIVKMCATWSIRSDQVRCPTPCLTAGPHWEVRAVTSTAIIRKRRGERQVSITWILNPQRFHSYSQISSCLGIASPSSFCLRTVTFSMCMASER